MLVKKKNGRPTTKKLATFKGLKKILFRAAIYNNAGVPQSAVKQFNLDTLVDKYFEVGPGDRDSPTYMIQITAQGPEKELETFLGSGDKPPTLSENLSLMRSISSSTFGAVSRVSLLRQILRRYGV